MILREQAESDARELGVALEVALRLADGRLDDGVSTALRRLSAQAGNVALAMESGALTEEEVLSVVRRYIRQRTRWGWLRIPTLLGGAGE